MRRRTLRGSNDYVLSRDLAPSLLPVADCKPLGRESRKHPAQQVAKLAKSLNKFGFVFPILIDGKGQVVAGWALVLAARQLGLGQVPAVTINDLTEPDLRMLRLALNRLSEDARWNRAKLALEFSELLILEPGIDLDLSGFQMGEIDVCLDSGDDEEDELPLTDASRRPVSRMGDKWICGEHQLICGDALDVKSYGSLLGADKAEMTFTDPPYNVPIMGNVSGLGAVKHTDFVMAAGELSPEQFQSFLKTAFGHAANYSVDGAIHMICMDWRHQRELLAAGSEVYSELKNLCVWNKSNAGMGSLYRSKHELIFVYKVGTGRHINNVALGRYGRNRTNVWDYPSQNALTGSAKGKLALHPTVKPVAMIADAMRDCSNRGGLILDPFGGAGTTLIAAERTGRRARVIELNPTFVDVSIERWQRLTGSPAVHAVSGVPFPEAINGGAAGTTRKQANDVKK